MSPTDSLRRQFKKAVALSDIECVWSWELPIREAHEIISNGVPAATFQFPIEGVRVWTFAESFWIAVIRHPFAQLLVEPMQEKAGYRLMLLHERQKGQG